MPLLSIMGVREAKDWSVTLTIKKAQLELGKESSKPMHVATENTDLAAELSSAKRFSRSCASVADTEDSPEIASASPVPYSTSRSFDSRSATLAFPRAGAEFPK